jgi:putative transposase
MCIVFCPKYRYRILRDEVGEYTKQQIYQLCQQKDAVEVLELNVQADHVHLVVSIAQVRSIKLHGLSER